MSNRIAVVYIAGPFRAPTRMGIADNIRRAEHLALAVARLGAMPLCPHSNTGTFDAELPQAFLIEGTKELMRRCDAVIFTDGWECSEGSLGERKEAERIGMMCFYDGSPTLGLLGLKAWLDERARVQP